MTIPPARAMIGVLFVVVLAHVVAFVPSEPYFNNDETRHVMTGVWFRDVLRDRPAPGELRAYTERYYAQYPATGLLIWPPAFYGFEGVFFLIFGDSFLTARVLVGLFALMACAYFFLLVNRTHGQRTAVAATLLLALSPLVFVYSSRVMLEGPALTWVLMAMFHFHRYLEHERRRDLALCCLATAMTALTRFDAVFLAPLFLFWLVAARRLRLLKYPAVLIGMGCAVLAVAPFWLLTAREFGAAHLKGLTEGTREFPGLLTVERFVYYPLCLPLLIGWAALVPSLIGLARGLQKERRSAFWPYLVLLLAVYVTFTPMAELGERHAIYWVPALAVFAVEGCVYLVSLVTPRPSSRPLILLAALVLIGTGVQTWFERFPALKGYEAAAVYVVEHNTETPVCLFDSYLNGGFIYHLRRHDPERRLWVLRGDKIFYGMLSEPKAGYEEHVGTQDEVKKLIHHFDPELIVVEEPQIQYDLPAARLLRQTLKDNPKEFKLVAEFPLESDHANFHNKQLQVWRKLDRNPNRADVMKFKILGLGRDLAAPLK